MLLSIVEKIFFSEKIDIRVFEKDSTGNISGIIVQFLIVLKLIELHKKRFK